ncbi:MAG TPA: ChbG/HpnK family deacetylase [Tepidisphaeraceae bacterium]|nr:ChbG/HpnK family deacetylase [Tepidisphaeraceae bacterium]
MSLDHPTSDGVHRLYINADDFGLHPDINAGIARCARAGRLSGFSISANGSAVDWDLARELQELGMKVGLHLTLVGEPWLSQTKTITKWPALVPMLALPSTRRAIENEAAAQIQIIQKNKLRVDHIDSHQHVHVIEPIWTIVHNLARQFRIDRIRVPWAPTPLLAKPTVAGRVLQLISASRRDDRSLPCIGLKFAGHNTIKILEDELRQAKRDVELVAHPGDQTDALSTHYAAWKFDWKSETEMLMSDDFERVLDRCGYLLGR